MWVRIYTCVMLGMVFFIYLKKDLVHASPSVFLIQDGDFAELVPAHQRKSPISS